LPVNDSLPATVIFGQLLGVLDGRGRENDLARLGNRRLDHTAANIDFLKSRLAHT
jgi:hypothetical protein